MTDRSVGPRCGNNPNVQLTPGDRKAVDDFKARLALQADAKPYIERAVWVDFDPLMEVIAATVWAHCARDSEDMPQLVCDDPRTIAAFAAAVARAHAAVPAPVTDRAALRDRIAALFRHPPGVDRLGDATPGEIADAVLAVLPAPADRATVLREAAGRVLGENRRCTVVGLCQPCLTRTAVSDELRRMADEAQQPETATDDYERTTGHLITCLAVAGGTPDPDCPCAGQPAVAQQPKEARP